MQVVDGRRRPRRGGLARGRHSTPLSTGCAWRVGSGKGAFRTPSYSCRTPRRHADPNLRPMGEEVTPGEGREPCENPERAPTLTRVHPPEQGVLHRPGRSGPMVRAWSGAARFDPLGGNRVAWVCRPGRLVPPVPCSSVRTRRAHPGHHSVPPSTSGDTREQAYVPAEQPSSCEDARFPPAHADPRRPVHPRGSSHQGTQAARGLM